MCERFCCQRRAKAPHALVIHHSGKCLVSYKLVSGVSEKEQAELSCDGFCRAPHAPHALVIHASVHLPFHSCCDQSVTSTNCFRRNSSKRSIDFNHTGYTSSSTLTHLAYTLKGQLEISPIARHSVLVQKLAQELAAPARGNCSSLTKLLYSRHANS